MSKTPQIFKKDTCFAKLAANRSNFDLDSEQFKKKHVKQRFIALIIHLEVEL